MLNIYNANNHSEPPSTGHPPELYKKGVYEKYDDPSGDFTGQELKYSFWYVRHRLLIHRIVIIFLIVLSAGTGLYSLFQLGTYVLFGLGQSSAVDQSLTSFENYTLSQPRFAPQPLQVVATNVFSGGVGKYDLVADVVNPNPRFRVSFEYYFSYNDAKTVLQTTTLLPGEHRPVASLGLMGEVYPTNATLVIQNIAWQRLSNHDYLDPTAWQNERLNFLVSNFEFAPQLDGSSANAETIRFTLTNQSAYSYKVAKFYVGLYLDQNLVGVLPLTIDAFKSSASKQIDLRSFGANFEVNDVKVFPLINVYDDSVYLPPEK